MVDDESFVGGEVMDCEYHVEYEGWDWTRQGLDKKSEYGVTARVNFSDLYCRLTRHSVLFEKHLALTGDS
jgi:hypothetical protein